MAGLIRGALRFTNVLTKTTAGNVVVTNETSVIVKKATGAATQVTLPATPSQGRTVIVKDGKGDAATNNITVVPATGTIDGAANLVMDANYESKTFMYGAGEWSVIGGYL